MIENFADAQRDRLIELFEEVELLLNHLQRLPETRIPRLFEPAFNERSRLEGTPVPPTNDIQYLMNRITAISVSLGSSTGFFVSRSGCNLRDLKANDPGPQLEDYAFLLWARDFLAAVTFPASVATIKVTQAFREYRSRSLVQRLANWPERWDIEPRSSRVGHAQVFKQYGRMLARQVRRYNAIAIGLIFLVIWGSVLIFSGRVLIRENDKLLHYESLPQGAKVQAASSPDTLAPTTLQQLKRELSQTQSAWNSYACPVVLMMRAPSAIARQLVRHFMHTEEKSNALESGKVALHNIPVVEPCMAQPDDSAYSVGYHQYRLEMMVDGLLGSILPSAYAGLGALAALFRRIGRKVEDETLGPSDIGGMRNSLILGLLTGTVVGLISDVVSWGGKTSAPLSTTALALLAGFASDRVFVMLDGVTDRIFGHPDAEPPPRPPKKEAYLARR